MNKMEKIHRVVANTYLNDPDTIPVVVNTIVLMMHYGLLLLIKLLMKDRTVYFMGNTWEQVRYVGIYVLLMGAISYGRVVLINKYIYLVSFDERVRNLHRYKIKVIEIQRLEKEMKRERDNYKKHKLRDRRDEILLGCYNSLTLR